MTALVLLVAGIGLADSLNPSTVGPALLLALRARGAPLVVLFAAGVFLTSFACGALIVAGPGRIVMGRIPHIGSHTRAVIEVAAGCALLVLAAIAWLQRGRVTKAIGKDPGGGFGAVFGLGAAVILVELPTAFPYFAALAAISAAHRSLLVQVQLVAIFNLAFVLPLLVIALARLVGGRYAERALVAAREALERYGAAVLAAALAAFGVGLVVFGLVGLV